jgi:hypothetical protein
LQKKILSAKERRERECRKRFFSLASEQGKKSERKYRKRFSLLKSGEKENTEKDFFPCEWARKKEWEKIQKKILPADERREREDRKRKRGGWVAPLIGAITRENSNLADRAPSKIVNLPAKQLAHLSLFLETFSIESSVADNFKKNKLLFLWKLHEKFPSSTRDTWKFLK